MYLVKNKFDFFLYPQFHIPFLEITTVISFLNMLPEILYTFINLFFL